MEENKNKSVLTSKALRFLMRIYIPPTEKLNTFL